MPYMQYWEAYEKKRFFFVCVVINATLRLSLSKLPTVMTSKLPNEVGGPTQRGPKIRVRAISLVILC